MVDAVVSIALERLAAIAEDKIREEIGLVRGVEEGVLYLSSELTIIRNVLEDAEKREYKEKSIQNWLKKLEDISYDVDDMLDEWNFAILKRHIEESENVVLPKQKVCFFIPWSCLCIKKVANRRDIALKIKRLKQRLDVIVKEKDRYSFDIRQVVNPQESEGEVVDPQKSDRVRSTSLVDVKEIQGREVDKDVLVNKLVLEGAGQESGLNVISIVGTGGIGKTTVAQLVYNDDRVINYFELRIWICVSNVFDEVRIAKGIVEIVKKSSPNVHELEALLECVKNCISGKKFLLVLDDVWIEDYNRWEPLKNSLKCGGPGSKILVTTRNERVARMMGTTEMHYLGYLSDIECWLLIQQIAFFGKREDECEEFYDIGKNIANKCKGLPLAAKVLGSLLRLKDTVEEWENVLTSEIWQLEQAKVDLFPHLLLSYNELSSAMKRCFSYCAIFPKDYKIDVEELIRMWMALGYLGSDGSSGDLELRGKEYFDSLRMRSFFQDFEDHGDEISCKMHDIVHDFAQFLTKRRSHDSEDRDGRVEEREKRSCQALDSLLVSEIKVNRSLFHPEEIPLDLLGSVTCLRVLSLLYYGLKGIPGNIANLIHLRYLDLSGNKFIQLQDLQTICKLYNLQTLYLNNCEMQEIPREIGNLIQLRHLDLGMNSLGEIPREIGNLIRLRHLDLGMNSLDEIPREIGNSIQLRHLNLCSNIFEKIPREIGNLIQLRHLDLGSNNLDEIAREIGNLTQLRHLNLRSNSLERIPREIGNLTQVRHLDLGLNSLDEIPGEIGNLIQLRHLDLSCNESLKELPETIYNLHNLRYLNLQQCGLYSLPEGIHRLINLRHLLTDDSDIERFPQGLERLTGLQTLTKFTARRDGGKLGCLKEMDQLSGSLNLRIYLHGQEEVKEAKKAALRNKKHIKSLTIGFFDEMSRSNGDKLVRNELMEALQPPPNLQHLTICTCPCTKFPSWMTSFLNHLKALEIDRCDYCEILPPLGKLPCLEELSVGLIIEFKFLNREFLGMSRDIDGSMPSSAVVIGFPKLKELTFSNCPRWKEWDDITAEEEINSALSIMPCLKVLSIAYCKLTSLPHRLLRKASALESLRIYKSSHLSEQYEDKNGPGWSFLSHIPHVKFEA